MAENALISDAVSHCVRGYWAVTHALRRQPQPTGSAAGGARVRQDVDNCPWYGVPHRRSSTMRALGRTLVAPVVLDVVVHSASPP